MLSIVIERIKHDKNLSENEKLYRKILISQQIEKSRKIFENLEKQYKDVETYRIYSILYFWAFWYNIKKIYEGKDVACWGEKLPTIEQIKKEDEELEAFVHELAKEKANLKNEKP